MAGIQQEFLLTVMFLVVPQIGLLLFSQTVIKQPLIVPRPAGRKALFDAGRLFLPVGSTSALLLSCSPWPVDRVKSAGRKETGQKQQQQSS